VPPASSTRSETCLSSSWQRASSTSSSTNRSRYQSPDWRRVVPPRPFSPPTRSLLCPSTTPMQRATCRPTFYTTGSCRAFSIHTTADPSTINPSGRSATSSLQCARHQHESRPRHATAACTALNRESQMSFHHTSIIDLTSHTNKSHIKITSSFTVEFS